LNWLTLILGLAGAAVVMLLLSRPPELRRWRAVKMWVSLPMLAVAGVIMAINAGDPASAIGQVGFYAFFIGIPAIMWAPEMAWHSSRLLSTLLHGDGRAGGGFRPEYHLARHYLKEGDLAEALRHCQEELDKEPNDFEGLLLLAQIWLDRKRPPEAIKALERIIASPLATDEQRATAIAEKQRLEYTFSTPATADAAPPPIKTP
jgi:hypothetical protein